MILSQHFVHLESDPGTMQHSHEYYPLRPYEQLALALGELNVGVSRLQKNMTQIAEYHKDEQHLTEVFGTMYVRL